MAATCAVELRPVAQVIARLQGLLQRARELKAETSVEPPLPNAELIPQVERLHEDFDDTYDQLKRFQCVEQAARELFYNLVKTCDIKDPAFVEIWNLLDIVLLCGDQAMCDPGLVPWLLEELLDSQTTHGCRTVFDYLDSRRDRLAQKDFHKKNLVFLRSCNELLRRLSRAEDAVFCGRVFFFLFQTFPLGDKSSVNLRGEFHTENTTKFDVAEQNGTADQMDLDAEPAKAVTIPSTPQTAGARTPSSRAGTNKEIAGEKPALASSELYPIFWRLQHDFSEPTRLFESANFAAFRAGLAHTIAKFKSTPTVVQARPGEENKRGLKRSFDEDGNDIDSGDHLIDNYNPKYLTSRDLFDLELSDLAFQRHILVQALILIDFLLSLTEKAKKKLAEVSTTNKAMLYQFTLSEEDTKWAVSTRQSIKSHLDDTAEGRHYCRLVETVLTRDKNWVRWKVESCPSIVRGPVSTERELAARKGARQAVHPRNIPDKPVGAMDLGFLDEGTGGGLEALKNPSRYTAPSIEKLVETVKTDKLDLDMAMDDAERTSLENAMQNAKWRALRQARSSNLSLLEKVESTRDLEDMLKVADDTEDVQTAEQEGDDGVATVAVTDAAYTNEVSIKERSAEAETSVLEGEEPQ